MSRNIPLPAIDLARLFRCADLVIDVVQTMKTIWLEYGSLILAHATTVVLAVIWWAAEKAVE